MESKNIKIVDEHGIDRVGNVVCTIDVEGSDYIFYWIERDEENDNIFVSKLIKNVDGTSNMINIDDDNEKANLSSIIKKLVKYSLENENDKILTDKISLDGKEYSLGNTIINREQYINVPKTYITTVKKAVTKVCSDYYNIDNLKSEDNDIFKEIPAFEPLPTENVKSANNNASLEEIAPIVTTPEVVVPQVEAPVQESTPVVEVKVEEAPIVTTPEVVVPQVEAPVQESTPVVEVKVEEAPVVGDAIPNLLEPETVKTSESTNTVETTSAVSTPLVNTTVALAPSVEEAPVVGNTLVFDATKESNLNLALGEVSVEKDIPVNEIDSVREFGQDESNALPEAAPVVLEKPMTRTLSKGYANNKFVTIVAILFFVASCVFLGYEIFNYFQINK